MARRLPILAILLSLAWAQWLIGDEPEASRSREPWRGLHVIVFSNDNDLEILGRQIPRLAELGLNVLVLEVNYNFEFKSQPELRSGENVITAAGVGTAGALDVIPKDIILCPWHYEKMPAYPSIPHFLKKGFRVLPASWKDLDASRALIEYSQQHDSPRMLGHLFTTWGGRKDALAEYPPLVEGMKLLQAAKTGR